MEKLQELRNWLQDEWYRNDDFNMYLYIDIETKIDELIKTY